MAQGRKASKELMWEVNRFTSILPFAPLNRPALGTEADAWVGRNGRLYWVRCEKEQIQNPEE